MVGWMHGVHLVQIPALQPPWQAVSQLGLRYPSQVPALLGPTENTLPSSGTASSGPSGIPETKSAKKGCLQLSA